MKKKLLVLMSSILLLAPTFISCGQSNENENNNNEPDINNPEKPNPDEGGDVTPDPKPNPDEGGSEGEKPVKPVTKVATLKEAKALCDKETKSYKENFNENVLVTIKGDVMCDFAISGTYHFMMLSDDTGILPILVDGNKRILDKYWVGNKYEVTGTVGSYRNTSCVYVKDDPIRKGEGTSDFTKFSVNGTINDIYTIAYSLKVEDNNASIFPGLVRFKATYVDAINDNLMLLFDGTKHIVLHGPKKVNSTFNEGENYEFYTFPSVYQGKRSGEFIKATRLNEKNEDVLDEMKNVAVNKTISELSQIDRYNDNQKLYPFIFKIHAFVDANIIDGKHHLVFVDELGTKIKYDKSNERPKAIYCKNDNHIVTDNNAMYSNLVPYYSNEVAGDFYFVPTDYQSNYHCFQGFVLDKLTVELEENLL